MIPDFDANGNLPPGTHTAQIDEVLNRFSAPGYGARLRLSEKLKDFFELARKFAVAIYLDGSYITTKLSPNDIDIALVLPTDFDTTSMDASRLISIRRNVKELDVFPFNLRSDENRLHRHLEFWSKDRNGNPKGIIQVEINHDKK